MPRVLRGGSWNNNATNLRAAYRNRNEPDNRNNNIGFRVARDVEPAGAAAITVAAGVPFYFRIALLASAESSQAPSSKMAPVLW